MTLLRGRRAVVTGGSRGIGRAIALALAEAGADVAVVARDRGALDAVAAEIGALGARAVTFVCDLTDPATVERMARAVTEALGGVDILVNNAGSSATHKLLDHPDDLWHRMLADNLTSVFYVTRAFLPSLLAGRRGRIVNVASTAAKTGTRYTAAYSAAKHGVLGLTRVTAAELAGTGVTANAVCPGFADTPMTDRSVANIVARTGKSDAEARELLAATSPQKRLIDPKEVATVVVFLVGNQSDAVNGQAINVDGGALSW